MVEPGGTEANEERLIAQHIALARHLASRFADRGEMLDDLIQVAYVGLVKAAKRFDPGRGVQFSTFATATITGELKRYFRDHRWGVRVARPLQDLYLKVRGTMDGLTQRLGRPPTMTELAAEVGAPVEAVIEALEVGRTFRPASVDAGGVRDGDDSDTVSLVEVDLGFAGVEDHERVEVLLRRLSPRQEALVRLRFMDELTQSQIAERMGMSQMQVSRLLARAIAQLRVWATQDPESETPAAPPQSHSFLENTT